MEYYIGIDIGTSAVKLTAIDETGSCVSCCERGYQYSEPFPGWKEISPSVWVEAVKGGLQELLLSIDRHAVKVIGMTGQMHTTVFLDQEGRCLRPAIMWNDMRTKEYIPELKAFLTQEDTVHIKNIISTGSPAVNLLWLRDHEAGNFNQLSKFLIGPDYLVYYFTGKYSTDYCEASTSSLYDPKQRTWSKTMQKLIGLNESVYPPIKGSQNVVGVLLPQLQEEFGLSSEVKVIAGTGDNPAAAVATGSLRYHDPVLSIGTSGVLVLSRDRVETDMKGKWILFSLDGKAFDNMYQGVVQSAGGSFAWYVKNILQEDDFHAITSQIDLEESGKNNLLFYPHLTGDKTIYADPNIRGAFLGIDTNTTREDMAAAVMEGICFAVRQLIQEMNLSPEESAKLKVTGGGSNSKVWMQILADVLNMEIEQLGSNEGAAYGAALMALNSEAQGNGGREYRSLVKIEGRLFPRLGYVKFYSVKYQKYLKIYKALKLIYQNVQ